MCDAKNILSNDGKAAKFWAGTNNTYSFGGKDITSCRALDFGAICQPAKICIEAWVSAEACGDDCEGGACQSCNGSPGSLDVFSHTKNSTSSFKYEFTMAVEAAGNPGTVFCKAPTQEDLRWVMVCRSDCPANAFNVLVDQVYLEL